MPTITLPTPTPPAGTTFAAVELHATADGESWRIVGAEPTRELKRVDGKNVEVLKPEVHAAVHTTDEDVQVRAVWVCEDATVPHVITTHDPAAPARRRRRLGGPR